MQVTHRLRRAFACLSLLISFRRVHPSGNVVSISVRQRLEPGLSVLVRGVRGGDPRFEKRNRLRVCFQLGLRFAIPPRRRLSARLRIIHSISGFAPHRIHISSRPFHSLTNLTLDGLVCAPHGPLCFQRRLLRLGLQLRLRRGDRRRRLSPRRASLFLRTSNLTCCCGFSLDDACLRHRELLRRSALYLSHARLRLSDRGLGGEHVRGSLSRLDGALHRRVLLRRRGGGCGLGNLSACLGSFGFTGRFLCECTRLGFTFSRAFAGFFRSRGFCGFRNRSALGVLEARPVFIRRGFSVLFR
mmetsp:Transcript_12029/g.44709  ORF Transcript_12029/g.44709 Transcript_12029/m.44709 type:complete len:300 (+) Transcript_12029:1090-1989(+)